MPLFRKLGMRGEHRLAMLRNQVTSLIKHGAITTTLTRAKELRRVAEWMVTWSKKGYTLPGATADRDGIRYRRLAGAWVQDRSTLQDLFAEMPVRFARRKGGYTRVLRLGNRRGDAAPIARIEWVEWDRPEDAKVFAERRAQRAEKLTQMRTEATEAIRTHRHSVGLKAVKSLGGVLNRVYGSSGHGAVRKLYAKVQARTDRARNAGDVEKTTLAPPRPQLESKELPEEYGVIKVPRNAANKYGGRGLVQRKKEEKATEQA